MSAAPRLVKAPPPGTAPKAAAPPARLRRLAARVERQWLPRLAWAVGRTGRPGLLGLALLFAAGIFLVSTHLRMLGEIEELRGDLAEARKRVTAAPVEKGYEPAEALRALPARGDLPAVLRLVFDEAAQARLKIDSGRYELRPGASGGGVVRYQVTLPITGSYPQLRAFLGAALETMPEVALSGLAIERKSIHAEQVEANVRFTVYTAAGAAPGGRRPTVAPDRVVAATQAEALFAPHSWYVPPPPKKAPPPPPPPPPTPLVAPTAPPFPYAFVGSYAPRGARPVYFLSRADKMVEARVGDKLDDVYQLESASDGQLVFVYLPLNIRQSLPAGVTR